MRICRVKPKRSKKITKTLRDSKFRVVVWKKSPNPKILLIPSKKYLRSISYHKSLENDRMKILNFLGVWISWRKPLLLSSSFFLMRKSISEFGHFPPKSRISPKNFGIDACSELPWIYHEMSLNFSLSLNDAPHITIVTSWKIENSIKLLCRNAGLHKKFIKNNKNH